MSGILIRPRIRKWPKLPKPKQLGKKKIVKFNYKNMDIITDFKSPHYSTRKSQIRCLLLHHTAGLMPGCRDWFRDPKSKVSCHYLLTRSGDLYCLVPDHLRAWHAGRGAYDLNKDGLISAAEKMYNDISLGIELEAVEPYDYTGKQIEILDDWCYNKCYEYKLNPLEHILAHKEIAPERKIDPANFDMDNYRKKIHKMMVG